MYIYAGKFDHVDGYAKNELWTVTIPKTIKSGNDAIVMCQWTKTADNVEKKNEEWEGKITKADKQTNGEIKIEFFKGDSTLYYWFEGTVSSGEERISLSMKNPRDEYCGPVNVKLIRKAD